MMTSQFEGLWASGNNVAGVEKLSWRSRIELGLIVGIPDLKGIPVHLNRPFQINQRR